ncbi:hypothetical protein [Bradyrhizobium sp. USDA 4508]
MAAQTMWQPFDWLEGIIEAPTITPEGKLIDKPGYHEETGLFYDPRNVPPMPKIGKTPEQAIKALAKLHDVLDEFPFADDDDDGGANDGAQSRAVAVAAILTAPVRRVINMCPIFVIDAPGQSNGKTLLADVIAAIPTGRGAGATTWSASEEEQRKVITSILLAGDLVVNFDNVNAPIGGKPICAVVTAAASLKDRLLGSTKMLELPTCTMWVFTGINMTVKDDATTRVVKIKLDAKLENPEQRVFKRPDLMKHVLENRGELLHACLTILNAYIVAGRPKASLAGKPFKTASRFGQWSDLVASALLWLDQPDPIGSQAAVIADDPVKEIRRGIMNAWQEAYGFDAWVTAKQLTGDSDDMMHGSPASRVADAIHEIAIAGNGTSANATATRLRTMEGAIVDGMKIRRRQADRARRVPPAWQLIDVSASSPEVSAPASGSEPWD